MIFIRQKKFYVNRCSYNIIINWLNHGTSNTTHYIIQADKLSTRQKTFYVSLTAILNKEMTGN